MLISREREIKTPLNNDQDNRGYNKQKTIRTHYILLNQQHK